MATFAEEVAADSPFAWWRFAETSGTSIADEQGSHDGTAAGGPDLAVTGPPNTGSAVTFDGTDDVVTVGTLGTFGSDMSSGFTVMFAAKWTGTGQRRPWGVLNTGTTTRLLALLNNDKDFATSNGRIVLGIRDDSNAIENTQTLRTDLNDGEWHLIHGVWTGTVWTLYVDGVNDTGTSFTDGGNPSTFSDFGFDMALGATNQRGTLAFAGPLSMDEMAFFQSSLTEARCRAHAIAAGLHPPELEVVGTASDAGVADLRDAEYANGYVYTAGLDTTAGDGLVIWDVSTPATPTVAAEEGTGLSGARGVSLIGNVACVTGRDNGGFVTIDITDPTSPSALDQYSNVDMEGARGVDAAGDYAYVGVGYLDPGPGEDGIAIFDISTPSTISRVARFDSGDDANVTRIGSVLIDGDLLYATGYEDGNLLIFDVTTRTAPTLKSTATSSELGDSRGLAKSGDYVFVACPAADAVVAIDVSDPDNPAQVSALTSTLLNGARNVALTGTLLWVAAREADAVALIDITDPANMELVGYATATAGMDEAYGVATDGTRGYVTSASTGDLTVLQEASDGVSGGSEATVTVSSEGAGRKVAYGGSTATVTASAEGAGTKHATGGSEATVTVSATGGGHAVGVISGGSESNVTVAATGGGRKVAYGASETTVTVAVDSAGFKRGVGSSEANLTVDAEGVGAKQTVGGSEAALAVTAEGDGLKRGYGGNDAAVTVDAAGGGSAGAVIGGSEATVTITASGAGHKIAYGSSEANIIVSAEGTGQKNAFGGSETNVIVEAVGEGFNPDNVVTGTLRTYRDFSPVGRDYTAIGRDYN